MKILPLQAAIFIAAFFIHKQIADTLTLCSKDYIFFMYS